MKTYFRESQTDFAYALCAVARDIECNVETRKYYSPLVLAIVDSMIAFRDGSLLLESRSEPNQPAPHIECASSGAND